MIMNPRLASPPLAPRDMQPGDIAVLQAMYDHLAAIPNPGPDVIYVKSLLVRLIESVDLPVLEPKLLTNFPNPFNPETWIPYQLAKPAAVTIKIYTQGGQFVRTLSLGQKDAGRYLLKDKAAYWDGRTDFGERAASGVYFYSLTANTFTATRKMLILK
ncbi:T9SS type A sorting domain-containing protein [Candidatus Poribacteria bacterium]|nr:T9SS type A sorting domain-containing protein [Candidatus Poribacteria bacterium]